MTDALPLRPSLDLLRRCLTPAGFVAAPHAHANYRRVWARDGVICGLAGLASGDAELTAGLQSTLQTLADHLGPDGQVPSNVALRPDGSADGARVSYGGLAGRVDAGPWFILGVALLAHGTDDRALAVRFAPAVARVRALLHAWEFNARGLMYVPQSGDWADEYDLHGYLLFDQALRLLALRAWAPLAADDGDTARQADDLAARIEATYWPAGRGDADASYHPAAYRAALDASSAGEAPFPFAALGPGGYTRRFDALGSAVAVLAGLWPDRRDALLDHGLALAAASASGLVPAFDPVIRPGDAGWDVLRANTRDTFSNRPGHYHNGGAWPMVNGWWAAALAAAGRTDDARALAGALGTANADGGFPEYLDARGAPQGTTPIGWSAAGEVLARAALSGCLNAWWAPDAAPDPEPDPADSAAAEVVVAGEILVDLLSATPADSLGDAPVFERHAGGSAANLATNLARLGVPTTLVATVGDDGFGRFLGDAAAPTGVALRLRTAAESPTSVVTVTRTGGTPDFAAYRHADRLIRPSQLPDDLLAGARVLHTSGFALSREPARTTLLGAAARAAAAGVALSVDLNVAPRSAAERSDAQATARAFLALGPLVKASRDDAERLFGERVADADVVSRLHAWGARLVCLTRGADGALVSWDGGGAEVPAAPVQAVVDATGAGDAFWAGFLAAYLAGADPLASAHAGGRLAALKLGRVGPLPDRVEAV